MTRVEISHIDRRAGKVNYPGALTLRRSALGSDSAAERRGLKARSSLPQISIKTVTFLDLGFRWEGDPESPNKMLGR